MDTFCDVLAIHRWDTPVILPVGARSSLDDPICVFSEQFLRQPRTSLIWCIGCVSHTQPTTGSTSTEADSLTGGPIVISGAPFIFQRHIQTWPLDQAGTNVKSWLIFKKDRVNIHMHYEKCDVKLLKWDDVALLLVLNAVSAFKLSSE